MRRSRGFTVIEATIVVAIVAICVIVGVAAVNKYTDKKAKEEEAKVVQKKPDASFMNRACISLVKKGGWKCTVNKQDIYFVHCEASVTGEKVTCRCFGRVSLKEHCNPEIYFSLAELNKEIKSLREDDASDEEDW